MKPVKEIEPGTKSLSGGEVKELQSIQTVLGGQLHLCHAPVHTIMNDDSLDVDKTIRNSIGDVALKQDNLIAVSSSESTTILGKHELSDLPPNPRDETTGDLSDKTKVVV